MEHPNRFRIAAAILIPLTLAASPSAAPGRGEPPAAERPTAPGFRYRLASTLSAMASEHVIRFILQDSNGRDVVSDTFTARLSRDVANPVFILFRDDVEAFTAARERAVQVDVYVDGTRADVLTFRDLVLDAAALDGPLQNAFFVNPRPRLVRHSAPSTPSTSPSPATTAARKAFKAAPFVESWQGCNDDDYCYAQWDYCNANCSPWDPYNPCEDCNSNLSACTGGVMTAQWTEDTVVSTTSSANYGCHHGDLYNQVTEHRHTQTFQTWMCDEADGTHWFTINTAESYYDATCWSDYYPGYAPCGWTPPLYSDPGPNVYC